MPRVQNPNIRVLGIRKPIPSGYVVGRSSQGTGDAELISIKSLATAVKQTAVLSQQQSYDLACFLPGQPAPSQTVMRVVAVRSFLLPANLPLSEAFANTAPSGGSAVYNLAKNGTNFGTLTFASGSQQGVFASGSDTSFAAGDTLSVVSTATMNGIADVSITFACTKQ